MQTIIEVSKNNPELTFEQRGKMVKILKIVPDDPEQNNELWLEGRLAKEYDLQEDAKYLKVEAEVRYWEDAKVNGVEDTEGTLIPFKTGDIWEPIIDLDKGVIVDWPKGTAANIHYKVCDAGEYWLLAEDKEKIAQYLSYYVPDEFLCYGNNRGYGDYIIFNVDETGKIQDYKKPRIDTEEWGDRDDY